MKKVFSLMLSPIKMGIQKLLDLWYDLKVWVYHKIRRGKPKKMSTKKADRIKDLIFYCAFMAVPLAMFVITQFVINGEAILLGFQKYEGDKLVFAGFENFSKLFSDFKSNPYFGEMFSRSLTAWWVSTIVCNIIPITFSFYVYKKFLGWRVFKILLFLPSLFSSIITVSIFKMIANEVIPEIWEILFGIELAPLIKNPHTTFNTLLFYNVWSGLGGGLLMHLAVMNSVDPSVTESAQLDGIGFYGELWHIVLPACYQVLMLGLITSFAGIFGGTLNLYAFYGTGAPSNSTLIGYYFQVRTLEAQFYDYPYLSSWGLFVTLIVTPLTLLLRYLINRFGPSEDTHEKKKRA